jgi:putative addiction module CopG family antidote
VTSFPADLEEYIQTKVASGEFRSREEFAAEALRLYRDLERRREQLKSDIQAALNEADRGESQPLDIEEIIEELNVELDSNGRP